MTKLSIIIAGLACTIIGSTAFTGPTAEDAVSDMDIAHIAYTAGEIDIRYAHLALALSETPEVRSFAETMIRDHSAINQQALALLQKLGATPTDNDTSQKLLQDAGNIRSELLQLEGKAFDQRYISNELSYHEFVNETVENPFIPHVQNAEFKKLLESALKTFRVHEGHARRLNKKLNK